MGNFPQQLSCLLISHILSCCYVTPPCGKLCGMALMSSVGMATAVVLVSLSGTLEYIVLGLVSISF